MPIYLTREAAGVDPNTVEFTIVDLETTGLEPGRGQRVCEVAAVRIRSDGTVLEELSTLVNPERRISPDSQRIHGISNDMVTGAPTFREIAGNLLRIMTGAVVVAHKLSFDEKFLDAEFARLGLDRLRVPGLCTLTTIRSHTDMPGYRLAGAVKSLSGAWPQFQHGALEDCRSTGRVLSTLLSSSPVRLTLTRADSVQPLPALPQARRLHPRVVPIRSGPYNWVGNLAQFLPSQAAPVRHEALEEYRRFAFDLIHKRPLEQADAVKLADLAEAAGLTRDTLTAANWGLWSEKHDAVPVPVAPAEARDLHHLAAVLGVGEQATAQLPPVTTELKGWRIVPLGKTAAVTTVTDWAAQHGATIGVRPSKTTRLIIAEPETASGSLPVAGGAAIPVLAPESAREFLKTRIAEGRTAQSFKTDELSTARLVFPASQLPDVWRVHELPWQVTRGKFTEPIEWLAAQASDPAVRFAAWQRDGGRLRLRAKRTAAPSEFRHLVDEALPDIQRELQKAPLTPPARRPSTPPLTTSARYPSTPPLTGTSALSPGPLAKLTSWLRTLLGSR